MQRDDETHCHASQHDEMNVGQTRMGVIDICEAERHRQAGGKSAKQRGESDPIQSSRAGRFAYVDPGCSQERQETDSHNDAGDGDERHVSQPEADEQRYCGPVPRQKQRRPGL